MLPPVKIQEADAKSLLLAQGLPVPPWAVARTPSDLPPARELLVGDVDALHPGDGGGEVPAPDIDQELLEVGPHLLHQAQRLLALAVAGARAVEHGRSRARPDALDQVAGVGAGDPRLDPIGEP